MAKLYSITIAAGLVSGNVRLAVNGHISELPRGERIDVTEEQKEALDNSREEYSLWGETGASDAGGSGDADSEPWSPSDDLVKWQADDADAAKQAVTQNASALQRKLAERQKLLSQLDQAKMQEQMNAAMNQLNATVGQDVPSLEEVRAKIENRYAQALGQADLQQNSVEGRMLEVEQASADIEAQSRLSELRSQLGLSSGTQAAGQVGPGTAAPRTEPGPGQVIPTDAPPTQQQMPG